MPLNAIIVRALKEFTMVPHPPVKVSRSTVQRVLRDHDGRPENNFLVENLLFGDSDTHPRE